VRENFSADQLFMMTNDCIKQIENGSICICAVTIQMVNAKNLINRDCFLNMAVYGVYLSVSRNP
jgi:hypothetical protein